jgi:hypothetical protein
MEHYSEIIRSICEDLLRGLLISESRARSLSPTLGIYLSAGLKFPPTCQRNPTRMPPAFCSSL